MTKPVDLEELKRLLAKATLIRTRGTVMSYERALCDAAPALIEELEAAREDVARLDAIEREDWFIGKAPPDRAWWIVIRNQVVKIGRALTLRGAIDAARKEST